MTRAPDRLEEPTCKQSLQVADPHVAFLCEAARYFEKRPTDGEDAAFWANTANAETCRRIAARLTAAPSEPQTGGGWAGPWRKPAPGMMFVCLDCQKGGYVATCPFCSQPCVERIRANGALDPYGTHPDRPALPAPPVGGDEP